jgi:hypothetical protein
MESKYETKEVRLHPHNPRRYALRLADVGYRTRSVGEVVERRSAHAVQDAGEFQEAWVYRGEMGESMNFTEQQLKNFVAYERVRKGGRYNMFDPRARAMTRMSIEEWVFCIKYYTELKEAAEKK